MSAVVEFACLSSRACMHGHSCKSGRMASFVAKVDGLTPHLCIIQVSVSSSQTVNPKSIFGMIIKDHNVPFSVTCISIFCIRLEKKT